MRILIFTPLFFILSCQGAEESLINESNEVKPDSLAVTDSTLTDTTTTDVEVDLSIYHQLSFGFADLDGDSVILLDKPSEIEANEYVYAFSSQGKLDIKHLSSQKATEDDNNRRNAYNLKNMEGELYRVIGQKAPLWETLLFMPKSFIQERQHLIKSSVYDARVLNSNQISQIEKDKNWQIMTTEHVESNNEGSLYFAYFDKKEDSILVSLVWVTDSGNYYLDFPAIYNEISTWRVDDGGVFDSEYFNIISIFKSEYGIEILTDWVGAEGNSVNYYLLQDKAFTPIRSTYFYSAPL